MMLRATTVFFGFMCSSQALASNFSYTNVGGVLGRLAFDDELVVAGEVYEDLGVFGIGGQYQLDEGFVLAASSTAASNNGPDTEVTLSEGTITGAFPIAVNDHVDVIPEAGFISIETEVCIDGLCASEDDDGVVYALSTRIWAISNQVEVFAGLSDTTLDDSDSVVSVGGGIWWDDTHSIRLSRSASDESTTTAIGYQYSW